MNLFIGNLDPMDMDEKILYNTFGAFGTSIKPPHVMCDDHTNQSKGFVFISYNFFEDECESQKSRNNRRATEIDSGYGCMLYESG